MFYFLSDLRSVAQFIIYLSALIFLSDLITDLTSHPENILFISFFLSDLISDLNSNISNILAYIFATEFNIR